jgi:hypothetical protein
MRQCLDRYLGSGCVALSADMAISPGRARGLVRVSRLWMSGTVVTAKLKE